MVNYATGCSEGLRVQEEGRGKGKGDGGGEGEGGEGRETGEASEGLRRICTECYCDKIGQRMDAVGKRKVHSLDSDQRK